MGKNILITPGDALINFSGASAGNVNLQVQDDGRVSFVGISSGVEQLTISDSLSGSVFTVNNSLGSPIIDVDFDNTITVPIGASDGYVWTSDSGGTATWQESAGSSTGSCIDTLWVSAISGCSPVDIGPYARFRGKNSKLTIGVVDPIEDIPRESSVTIQTISATTTGTTIMTSSLLSQQSKTPDTTDKLTIGWSAVDGGSVAIQSISGGTTGTTGTTTITSNSIVMTSAGESTDSISITPEGIAINNISLGKRNILNPLILDNIGESTTSVAIYGLNVVTSASSANIACRLPVAQKGFSTTIINESDRNILVYPSAVGGSINGLIDMAATLPPDATPYIFECIANPLPGAWTYTAPATNQYVLPEIVIPHTGGTGAIQYWGVGKTGTTIGANTWGGTVKVVDNYNGTFTFSPGPQYWDTVTDNGLPVSARLVRAKVYTNFVSGDTASLAIVPTISRYVAYMNSAGGLPNHTASGIDLTPITTVPPGTLSVPPEIGDFGTYYSIEDYPSNPVISPGPSELDEIGLGLYSQNYFIFSITLFSGAMFAVKDYKFRIILEYI